MKNYEFNNIIFHLGQSANENWNILDNAKNTNEDYIWFHLDSFPSPYVIMDATISDISDISDMNNVGFRFVALDPK